MGPDWDFIHGRLDFVRDNLMPKWDCVRDIMQALHFKDDVRGVIHQFCNEVITADQAMDRLCALLVLASLDKTQSEIDWCVAAATQVLALGTRRRFTRVDNLTFQVKEALKLHDPVTDAIQLASDLTVKHGVRKALAKLREIKNHGGLAMEKKIYLI